MALMLWLDGYDDDDDRMYLDAFAVSKSGVMTRNERVGVTRRPFAISDGMHHTG